MFKNFFSFVFELVKIVVISLVIIIPIRYFLIQPFYVKGASMEPNFFDHEYLIIDEISYRFNDPQRGDIIVFKYPYNQQEYFIKRVIGLPGEKVLINDGQITIINSAHPEGFIINEPYLPAEVKTYSMNEEAVVLNNEEYFVLGDNRTSSKDSRSFGPVNHSLITGRVFFRGWPFNRLDLFKTPAYE
jgi:signal peptidase I